MFAPIAALVGVIALVLKTSRPNHASFKRHVRAVHGSDFSDAR